MKLISEYLFAAMFFLASGLSFSIGSVGAGIVCAALGTYFPIREAINEMYEMICSFPHPRLVKIFLFGGGLFCLSSVIHLIYLDLTHLVGILGIAALVYFHGSEKTS